MVANFTIMKIGVISSKILSSYQHLQRYGHNFFFRSNWVNSYDKAGSDQGKGIFLYKKGTRSVQNIAAGRRRHWELFGIPLLTVFPCVVAWYAIRHKMNIFQWHRQYCWTSSSLKVLKRSPFGSLEPNCRNNNKFYEKKENHSFLRWKPCLR